MNHIEWKFTYCDPVKQDGSCSELPKAREAGDLFIHIREDVDTIDRINEIHPPADQSKN